MVCKSASSVEEIFVSRSVAPFDFVRHHGKKCVFSFLSNKCLLTFKFNFAKLKSQHRMRLDSFVLLPYSRDSKQTELWYFAKLSIQISHKFLDHTCLQFNNWVVMPFFMHDTTKSVSMVWLVVDQLALPTQMLSWLLCYFAKGLSI